MVFNKQIWFPIYRKVLSKWFTADFIAAFIAEFTADQSVHFEPPESINKPKIF